MKKSILLILLFATLILAGCGMTQKEKLNKIQECKEMGFDYRISN